MAPDSKMRIGSGPLVHHRRNLGVRVHFHESARELLPLADIDEPGVVLGTAVTEREQLLEQDTLTPFGVANE